MTLQLDDKFYIEGDLNSFTLYYRESYFDKEANKERISRDQWYYSNIKGCLEAYIEKSIVGCTSAKEILDKLEEVKKVIKELK